MNLSQWFKRRTGRSNPQLAERMHELQKEGFTRIRGGFADGLIEEVLDGAKRALKRNDAIFGRHIDSDGHYPRIINLQALHKPLLRLFTDNALALAVQDEFFDAPSSLYTSLYYERGSAQKIHRDTPYFTTRPEYRYLGVWVALEDADEWNGCLEVIRKGHLIPEFDRPAIALQHYESLDQVPSGASGGQDILGDAYQAKVLEASRERGLSIERVTARAGDVIIWHPQLPHGGSHIKDLSRTRHSFVMHTTPEGARVYQQDAFFNPDKYFPERAKWRYGTFAGRKYVENDSIDIGHREIRPIRDFVL